MALTLPLGTTAIINGVDTSNQANTGKIDITTQVGKVSPVLTIPSFLDIAKNTSHEGLPTDLRTNMRFVGMTKNENYKPLINSNGTISNDPRNLVAQDVEVLVKQITPQAVNNKYQALNWDLNVEGVDFALAQKMSVHMTQRRTTKEIYILEKMAKAAHDVQTRIATTTTTAITFELGAHKEAVKLADMKTTANLAWDKFNDMTTNFGFIGLDKAKEAENKTYSHAIGISDGDMLVLVSKQYRQELFKTPSLLASDIAYGEVFKKAGVKMINEIAIMTRTLLPAGVHAMCITTGIQGTFAHYNVADKIGGNLLIDPKWSKAKRLDLWDEYVLDVIYDFQIFIMVEDGWTPAVAPTPYSAEAVVIQQNDELTDLRKTMASMSKTIKTLLDANKVSKKAAAKKAEEAKKVEEAKKPVVVK